MMFGELSKIHNITYTDPRFGSLERYDLMTNDITTGLNFESYEEIYLQYYSGYSFYYCVNLKVRNRTSNLGYDTWIKPMDIDSWTMMIVTWVILTLFYTLNAKWVNIIVLIYSFSAKLLDTFYLISCSGINGQRKGFLFTLITLSSFMYWELYQNEITGLTNVIEKIEPFRTTCKLSNSGFKIRWQQTYKIPREAYNKYPIKFYHAATKVRTRYQYVSQK